MGLLSWAIRRVIRRRLRRVARALEQPAAAQERVLLDMVRRAAHTEWGRGHGYERIRTVRDFQQAVPVTRYEQMAPLWHRAFDGARDLAWPGHIRYFTRSSGTTTGASKLLPLSREAIRANIRSGALLVALCEQQAPGRDIVGGQTLYFGSITGLEPRGACLLGDASGIMTSQVPSFARRFRLPEPEVAALEDWEEKVEAVCTRYLHASVRMVVGMPMWSLILFRRLLVVAGERLGRPVHTVREVWPQLGAYVHFGMSFEPYRRQFDEVLGPEVARVNTYSSSEGGMNAVQSDQADPGMLLLVDAGAFYEFVPLAELDSPQPSRLTLDQVELDEDYAILLTTPSGVWAYDLGDVVRFTSLRPPKVVFAGRSRLGLNAFGERLIQENLDGAVAEATAALEAAVRDYTVTSYFPSVAPPCGGHLWLLEFDGDPPPLQPFLDRIDAHLRHASNDYAKYRDRDYAIAPPRGVVLAPGTFYEWAKRLGRLGGQSKVPRVARSQQMVDELLEVSRSLGSVSP